MHATNHVTVELFYQMLQRIKIKQVTIILYGSECAYFKISIHYINNVTDTLYNI